MDLTVKVEAFNIWIEAGDHTGTLRRADPQHWTNPIIPTGKVGIKSSQILNAEIYSTDLKSQ